MEAQAGTDEAAAAGQRLELNSDRSRPKADNAFCQRALAGVYLATIPSAAEPAPPLAAATAAAAAAAAAAVTLTAPLWALR